MTHDTQKNTPKGLKGLFANFGTKLLTALTRFPLTFACVVAVAMLFVMAIGTDTDTVYTKWIMGAVVSAFATLSVYLFTEKRLNPLTTHAINFALIGLIMWLFSTFSTDITDANATQFTILAVSFFLALFFAGYIADKNSLRWWDGLQEMLFQVVTSALFAGILMGGLSLAFVSLDKLFGLKINDDVYAYLAVFCFLLFMPSYFMSQISEKSTSDENLSITYPPIYKILGLYILLPILAIYTFILYGYLAKIIATWELPNGWVSWLVSILAFVGFITMIIVHPISSLPTIPQKAGQNTRLSSSAPLNSASKTPPSGGWGAWFSRFFPIILIPLLILMFVGIMRRFSDYGITINRLLVLILNLWFFGVSIYLFISRSRQPKWILISFSLVAFLSAVGPCSVINVTEKSLKKEFSALLAEANWTNTKDAQIKTLDKEKQIRLSDVAYYLQRTYGVESIRPMFNELGETATVRNLITKLGISEVEAKKDNFFNVNIVDGKSFDFDIKDYRISYFLKYFNNNYLNNQVFKSENIDIVIKNDNLIIKKNNSELLISLKSIIEKGFAQKDFFEPKELTIDGESYKLLIISLYGEFDKDNSAIINRFEGLLLLK